MLPSSFTSPEKNIAELGIHEGMTVVDLGAGMGAYTIILGERVGDKGRVIAVEVQKELLANIKNLALSRGLNNVEVVWGNIEQTGGTKIKDGLADAVVISNVLFQAEDKQGLLREAKRILKTGGKLLVVEWKDSFNNLGPAEDAIIPFPLARDMCERQGFVFKKEFNAGEHHYGFIVYKT